MTHRYSRRSSSLKYEFQHNEDSNEEIEDQIANNQIILEDDDISASVLDEEEQGEILNPTNVAPQEPHFSFRAIIGGLIVGSIMCFSNMYFGLQTGWVTMGSLQSTLLGFGGFLLLQKLSIRLCVEIGGRGIFKGLGPLENVLLQTTAVATATMPLAGGFVGIIPALKMLPDHEREGIRFDWWVLILWGLSLSFFGVFFAVPLRKQTILREQLKFPSGTATAQMIRVLHKLPDDREKLAVIRLGESKASLLANEESSQPMVTEIPLETEDDWNRKWKVLLWTFSISSIYTLISFFIPVLSNIPIFSWIGLPSLTNFNWILTPSLSYVGQGMIMGTRTGVSMAIGAIVGWGILGPVAKAAGWAPGPVNSWENGAKGWILWVSLSIMLAEALMSLLVLIVNSVIQYRKHNLSSMKIDDPAPDSERVGRPLWISGLIVSSLLCVVIVTPLFKMPLYEPVVAIIFALFVSVLAVRALGETDLNPVSGVGKVSQIIFGAIAPGNLVSNLVAGAIAEAGAQQAGDMMQDLKTGHLLHASPRAQFFGQLIGSFFSVFISVAAYELYSTAYEIPSNKFPVPTAGVWIDMARLVNGGSLAQNVLPCCIISAILVCALPIVESIYPTSRRFLPSGIAAAIAMYVTPNWTIPRVIGSLVHFIWSVKYPRSHTKYMIVVASGFVLGEGITSIFTALLKTSGVPVMTCIGCIDGLCSGC